MLAQNIEEVIRLLDDRIARARAAASPMGYFPALYRKVTVRVRDGIRAGEFEDNPRMERLDVVFANRYLDALDALDAGRRPTGVWDLAFTAARSWRPIVLQHLLVGMNAHINLDLGIAAAETAPGQSLPGLKCDFEHINTILASLTGGVKKDLTDIWPALGFFDEALGTAEDVIANFSMEKARDSAWALAEQLASTPAAGRAAVIRARDEEATKFGRFLLDPGWMVRFPALIVRVTERGSVPRKIDLLVS